MAAVHAAVDHGDLDAGALGDFPGLGDAGFGQPVFLVPPGVGVRGGRPAASAAARLPPARAMASSAEAVRRSRAVALVMSGFPLLGRADARRAVQLMLRAIPSRISCSLAVAVMIRPPRERRPAVQDAAATPGRRRRSRPPGPGACTAVRPVRPGHLQQVGAGLGDRAEGQFGCRGSPPANTPAAAARAP